MAACGFSGLAFGIFFVVNIVALAKGSAIAIPFLAMLVLLALWFGVLVPLVSLGAWVGHKHCVEETPAFPRTALPQTPLSFRGIRLSMAIAVLVVCVIMLFSEEVCDGVEDFATAVTVAAASGTVTSSFILTWLVCSSEKPNSEEHR
jgi:hypothetical protein